MLGRKRYYPSAGKRFYPAAKRYNTTRRSTTGRALSAARSQKIGSKNVYYNCSVENTAVSMTFGADGTEKGTYAVTPMFTDGTIAHKNDVAPMCRVSPLADIQFRSMCHSYDQCRLVSMKVTLQVTPGTSNMVAPCTLYTLWNRCASASEVGLGTAMTDSDGVPSLSAIRGTGATLSHPLGGYQKYTVTRAIYPKDAQEKMNWWDCDIIYLGTAGASPTSQMYFKDWWVNGANTSNHAFMPCLYWGVQRAISGVQETWYVNVKVEYNFAFRNQVSKLSQFAQYNAPGYVNPEGNKSNNLLDKDEEKEEPATAAASTQPLSVEDDPGTS